MKASLSLAILVDRRGFSLVELLVGIVIGMVGLLVIFKTVAIWDVHTRSTTAGGEADTSGSLAMFNIERDIKQAGMGFGMAAFTSFGCVVKGIDGARPFQFPLVPVQIVPDSSGTGGPDTLNVLYGSSSFFVSEQTYIGSTTSTKVLRRRNGFRAGDVAAVVDTASSNTCRLIEVTDTSDADGVTIGHATGTYTSVYDTTQPATARYNGTTTGTFSAGKIYNLGPAPRLTQWSVSPAAPPATAPTLQRSDVIQGSLPFEIGDGVIDLRVRYGVDSNGDGKVSDGVTPSEWTTTTPPDWTKLLAVRVALLVRSKQFEKSADPNASGAAASPVTPTAKAPSWSGGTFTMRNVDGSTDSFGNADPDPNNWRYYRYRVYEKDIPLRNMIWGTQAP